MVACVDRWADAVLSKELASRISGGAISDDGIEVKDKVVRS